MTGYIRTLHDRINYRGMVDHQLNKMVNKQSRAYAYDGFYSYDEWDNSWWTGVIQSSDPKFADPYTRPEYIDYRQRDRYVKGIGFVDQDEEYY